MATPIFRNADKFQVLPFRDWIRQNMPTGAQGFVAEDLDLILRWYGTKYKTDDIGAFALVELKFKHARIGYAQARTFHLIHCLLRSADPNCIRYLGYFIINYSSIDWNTATFATNGISIDSEQFRAFLHCDRELMRQLMTEREANTLALQTRLQATKDGLVSTEPP